MAKNGEPFDVYKMRTMHPYSEFLQTYIYERNNLKDGGKFYKDFRVTTMGRIMRRFWIDELPTIYNLMNGDMKLVGVRPLSVLIISIYTIKNYRKKELHTNPASSTVLCRYAQYVGRNTRVRIEIPECLRKTWHLYYRFAIFFLDITKHIDKKSQKCIG